MIGRKSVLGVVVLCALAFSAFAAGNASASFQIAVECAPGGTGFGDAHCVEAGVTHGHAAIPASPTWTLIDGTNAKTASGTTAAAPSRLKGKLSGVETELECTGLSGEGELMNNSGEGTEWVEGKGKIHYTGCSVTKPAGKGCKVKGSKVDTEELSATTKGQAASKLAFSPVGEKFANITIEGCSVAALNNTFPVTGSLVADTNGATTTTTHAGITAQKTLTFGGNPAGLEGALTITMFEGNPISLT
jgi:hypothetical protein